ncbi:MAG TPA: terminase [Myxococcaceae bacterium]|nr:terminase [Myxococcaceae bacterium]
MTDDRGPLLAWQWSRYPAGHRDRRNLLAHALTAPVFQVGTVAVVMAPFVNPWLAPLGLGAMAGVMALQARTHRLERASPSPFRGPADLVARLFVEQWITFPRYVVTGGFREAWKQSG